VVGSYAQADWDKTTARKEERMANVEKNLRLHIGVAIPFFFSKRGSSMLPVCFVVWPKARQSTDWPKSSPGEISGVWDRWVY